MEFSFKMKVNASKEKVWEYYADVEKWYTWEDDLEDITLNGEFEKGAIGVMKLAGMPPMEYILTDVAVNKMFCDKTSTPMGDVYFNQIIEEEDGLFIKHSVGLESSKGSPEELGFLKQIFSDVPDSIMALRMEVEK